MPDEYIKLDYSAERPNFDTPPEQFGEVWQAALDPALNALINKHVFLGFLEHFESLYSVDSFDCKTGHVGAAVWAECFDGYLARLDIEAMFCDIGPDEHEPEYLQKMIGSFQRIIDHLTKLAAEEEPS